MYCLQLTRGRLMKRLLWIMITMLMFVAGCSLPTNPELPPSGFGAGTTRFSDVHIPKKLLDKMLLREYSLAYCWVATERDAFGFARTDVIVQRGDGSKGTTITYPTKPPTSPISLGCYGVAQSIRIDGRSLRWRPRHNQITMIGTAGMPRGDNFYFVDLSDSSMGKYSIRPHWNHEKLFRDPNSLHWSSTGEWLATDALDADGSPFGANIWIYNPDTQSGKQLTDIHGLAPYMSNPVWSSDDQYISFTYGPEPSGIGIVRLRDDKLMDVTDATQEVIVPWRFEIGEGLIIKDNAFIVQEEPILQYYLIANAEPQWDKENGQVIFAAPTSRDRVTLFKVDKNGQNITDLLPDLQGLSTAPTLSPDGRDLAFVRYAGWNKRDRVEIAIYEMVSGKVRSLVVLPAPENGEELYVSGMDWTPDGKYLAFSSNHGGESDIYVISADGQSWVNLTAERRGDALNPVWRP